MKPITPLSKSQLTEEEFRRADAAVRKLVHRQADRKRAGEPVDVEAATTILAWEQACSMQPSNHKERMDRYAMIYDVAHTRGLLT